MDLSDLLGTSGSAGLLSPEQQTNLNTQTLQSLGAGLMAASGPSPYKPGMRLFSDLGAGLQAGIAGRNSAMDAMLKQSLVRAKTLESLAPFLKLKRDFDYIGQPLPENYQRVIDSLMSVAGVGPRPGVGVVRPGTPGTAGPGTPATGIPSTGIPSTGAPAATGVPSTGAPAATGAPAPGTPAYQNALLDFAKTHGYNPFDVLSDSPGHAALVKHFEDSTHALNPDIAASDRQKKIMEAEVARHEKLYPALVGLGQSGRESKHIADLSIALARDPNFSSGIGAPLTELWNKVKVALGGDPGDAFSQEAFRKVTNANINTQVTEMRGMLAEMGPTAGRIFAPQITFAERASQSLGNTPAGNRLLAEIQSRLSENNIAISNMAIKYAQEHHILDSGFDAQMAKYLDEHPLFTKEEMTAAGLRKIATEGLPTPSTAPKPPSAAPAPPAGAVHRAIGPNGEVIYFDANGKRIE